jgi:hypothetical protein
MVASYRLLPYSILAAVDEAVEQTVCFDRVLAPNRQRSLRAGTFHGGTFVIQTNDHLRMTCRLFTEPQPVIGMNGCARWPVVRCPQQAFIII